MANYLQKFAPGLSELTKPIRDVLFCFTNTPCHTSMMCIYIGFRFSSIGNTGAYSCQVLQIGLLLVELAVLWSYFLGLFRSSI